MFLIHTVFIIAMVLSFKERANEKQRYKTACEQYIQKLQKKKKQLSVKNKFIATLTHEMRNITTRYQSWQGLR
jgi:hypothetical protein